MRAVYQAENLIDAHLVRGRLACEGIDAMVTGEFLAGAMGELPVAGLLAVWVADDDLAVALQFLQAWQTECAESAVQTKPTECNGDFGGEAFLA